MKTLPCLATPCPAGPCPAKPIGVDGGCAGEKLLDFLDPFVEMLVAGVEGHSDHLLAMVELPLYIRQLGEVGA